MNGLCVSARPTHLDSLDHELKQIAIAAQRHPPKTRERQHALARLVSVIQRSGRLVRPRREQFLDCYDEIYAEAVQRLFTHICEKIDTYQPERGEVLQWANFLLNRQFFIEASRELLPMVPKGIDPKTIKRLTLDDLDRNNPNDINPQLVPLPSQQILQCLEEDPEGAFRQSHIDHYPAANFQFLATRRLAGYSWQELSTELGIRIPTLSSFYQRCLTKFAPQLKEYLS
ncbi:MAG: sigma-70 family RNA polymerase sigma factor [Kovacikia sp.]